MMKNKLILIAIFTGFMIIACNKSVETEKKPEGGFALAIHGGSGNIDKLNLTDEEKKAYHHIMDSALHVGYDILKTGGSSIMAVEKVIKVLEDSPLFNAGKGSVLCNDGSIEMDAAIMDGKSMDAGAVAGVTRIKNPISAAKMIMSKSKYVFLYGEGAEELVEKEGMKLIDPSYFVTEHRIKQLEKVKKEDEDEMSLDHDGKSSDDAKDDKKSKGDREGKFGTVGCVALDQAGNLAAGTSTGGLVNKKFHRIGDSPIIGSGTYAENNVCAISCTGRGEDFIKNVVAYDIAARMKYGKIPLQDAVAQTIQHKLKDSKGRGGCVAIDANGTVVFNFTTSGMFRGSINAQGEVFTAIGR